MFGTTSAFGSRPGGLFSSTSTNTMGSTGFGMNSNTTSSPFGQTNTQTDPQNPNKDIEVQHAPEDTVQALKFNPQPQGSSGPIFLAAGSWDFTCRVWQINADGSAEAKAVQNLGAPVLSLDWFDDSSKVFLACADKQAKVWDLASNQVTTVGQHDAPIQSCHWITSPNYSCLMTGGWDRTLRFWDMRQLPTQQSMANIQLPERVYCSDMLFPMAVVGLANRRVKIYKLDGTPSEVSDVESPLKYQCRSVSIFKKNGQPAGYGLGSIEGRVAIQNVETMNAKDNFTFKCHRSPDLVNNAQEIYPINDIKFHPIHYTLATVGGDGRYMFWDKDSRTKLKNSEPMPKQITKCDIHQSGNIFAYATGYDWSQGHEANQQPTNARIFLHRADEDLKPKKK
ncbi:hypothetical protein M3Y98_00472700 [Aphelenchoides besseyi]|nr:hypothetical protein M3Y98_00472700 [Aphelenchoides besseyi]KAI6207589.1 hypothetical protein M3Y96_00024900 [Aphelenchoides besseyi]